MLEGVNGLAKGAVDLNEGIRAFGAARPKEVKVLILDKAGFLFILCVPPEVKDFVCSLTDECFEKELPSQHVALWYLKEHGGDIMELGRISGHCFSAMADFCRFLKTRAIVAEWIDGDTSAAAVPAGTTEDVGKGLQIHIHGAIARRVFAQVL